MMAYKVYYKDYAHRIGIPIGRLAERRKDLRGMTPLETGMRWAMISYGEKVVDKNKIFVIPEKTR